MTGTDDGEFYPHPGDPWYSGPSDDEEAGAGTRAEESEVSAGREPRSKKTKRRKRERRSGRSGRGTEEADGVSAAASDFDPTTTAFDSADESSDGGHSLDQDDPFDVVLKREGGGSRHRGARDDDVPPPAWTVDRVPDSDQALPIEQPSWIGQTTAAASGVETVGFEPTEAVPDVDVDTSSDTPGSDPDLIAELADSATDSSAPAEADAIEIELAYPTEMAETDVASVVEVEEEALPVGVVEVEGEAVASVVEVEGEALPVGEYGVAGPEAFDALETDDATTEELDDWDTFVEGSSQVSGPVEYGDGGGVDVAAETLPASSVDDWAEPELKKRRRFFGRGKADRVQSAADGSSPDAFVEEEVAVEDPEFLQAQVEASTELPVGGEAFDEWTEPELKKRRGFFGRGGRDRGEEVDVDDSTGIVWDDEPVGTAASEAAADSLDADEAAPPDFGDLFEPITEEPILATDEIVMRHGSDDEAGPVIADEVGAEGVAAAVADALEALEASTVTAWDEPLVSEEVDLPIEPASEEAASLSVAQPAEGGEQPDLFGDSHELPTESEVEVALAAGEEEPLVSVPSVESVRLEPAEPVIEDAPDWEGDPGRIPESWFAAIDEDEVVPPPVGDTPETEWAGDPARDQWVDQEQPEPTDVFDIDEPEPMQRPQPQPQLLREDGVAVPEGYESWQEAVEDAVELGAGVDARVDELTYGYELQAARDAHPVTNELPAGFEAFPGTTDVEVFDLPAETMRHEMEGDGLDGAWTTDSVDAEMLTGEMDTPFPVGEDELEEQIYAGPGTIEHRDLAAVVAEGIDDDTQWQAISAAIPGVETGVLGFEDVADLGTGGEYVAPVRSDIGTRVITGVVLIGLLFGSLYVAEEVFAGFIGLVVMLGLVEFYGSLRRSGYLPLSLFGIVGGVGTLVATWFHGPVAIPVGVLLTSTITFFFYAFSQTRRDTLSNAGLTVLGVGWVVATVAFVIPIARSEEHVVLILAIVAVTAATDVGAFAFGRMWGRSPLAPILSPNKTTEGLAGGVMLSLAVAGAFGFFELGPFDLNSGLALGVIVAFLAPIGDLSESMIKRSLGIKDMGSILPGHGGVLDRIDAFLFVIPAAWVLYETIGYLG